jgi:hypothetical protein
VKRAPVVTLLFVLCGFLLWAVGAQRTELNNLKREQQTLLGRLAPEPVRLSGGTESAATFVSTELLRLRNEVSRLTARKAELTPVIEENRRLKAETQTAGANEPGLAPGYVRRSEARMAGFGSPEATIESMLWALEHRDFDRFLQAFSPEVAEEMQARSSRSNEELEKFLKEAQVVIGMGIVERVSNPDGSLQIKLQVLPEIPPAEVRMVNLGGEWKLDQAP